jgi:transcriptional regulator with XRE-family HTH domain
MFALMSSESVARKLGERVRLLRLMRNLSQQELAHMTASSLSSIRRLESVGKSTLDLVIRVAQTLQAIEPLERFLAFNVQSIAELEAINRAQARRRARKKGGALSTRHTAL